MREGLIFEITGSKIEQRDWITGRIGILRIKWERLDSNTWNLMLSDDREFPADDIIEEWAETYGLGCRLV